MKDAIDVMASGDDHIEEGARFEECCRVHEETVEKVRQRQPDLFLDGGDIFDKASTPNERLFAAKYCKGITEVCPLIITKGNHDKWRELLLLTKLQTRFPIHVVEDARVIIEAGIAVGCVAWPAMASELDEEGSREALRNVLRGLGSDLRLWAGPRILLGHLQVDRAETGAGQPLIGRGFSVPLGDLALAGADVVVLSHIHKAQHWRLDTGRLGAVDAIYCGSQHRTDWGESENKSVLSISMNVSKAHLSWMREPTSARPMLHVEGAYVPDLDTIVVPPADFPGSEKVQDADVRLRYSVPSEFRDRARGIAETLRAHWLDCGAASVKVEAETVTSTRSRAPQVAAAKTLHEKVEALWESRGDRPEAPRDARILGRLGQLEAQS